jgi:hypothetical protein
VKIFLSFGANHCPVVISGRTIDVITRHTFASCPPRDVAWRVHGSSFTTEEDVMAPPRPSRAHVTGRIVALILLAAAPAGTPWIASYSHTTAAAGRVQFFRWHQLTRLAARAILS